MRQEPPKEQKHPAFHICIWSLPFPLEVTTLPMLPEPKGNQRTINSHGPPRSRSKNLGQKIHNKANHNRSCSFGAQCQPSVMAASVQSIGHPTEDKRANQTEQQGMTDTAMKSEVIQLTQEVLSEHVHIWNGTRHSAPNHCSIANAAT